MFSAKLLEPWSEVAKIAFNCFLNEDKVANGQEEGISCKVLNKERVYKASYKARFQKASLLE